jgi:hypothetical protein
MVFTTKKRVSTPGNSDASPEERVEKPDNGLGKQENGLAITKGGRCSLFSQHLGLQNLIHE